MKKKTNDSGPSRRTGRSPRDSRSAILESAFRLFSERGFHGTTTKEIAKAAGISEGLIFHHFESKVNILIVIIEDVLAGGEGIFRSLLDGESSGDPAALLKKAFDRIEEGARTGRFRDVIRMLLNSMMALPPGEKKLFVRRIHDALWLPMTQHLSLYLKGSGIDPYVFFRMIQGTFMGYILFQEVLGWKDIVPLNAKKYRDTAVGILVAPLKSEAGGSAGKGSRNASRKKGKAVV